MRAQSASFEADDSFWQGYVSAIACLLLALLLLMSILALGIILGQGATATLADERAQEPVRPLPVARAPVPAQRTGKARPAPEVAAWPDWVLRFPEDTWRIGEEQRIELSAKIARATLGGDQEWNIWVQRPSDDDSAPRGAYLRLIAVRDLLISTGIPPTRISMRIRSDAADAISGFQPSETTVMVSSVLQRGKQHGN
jgi:hypothetical protein